MSWREHILLILFEVPVWGKNHAQRTSLILLAPTDGRNCRGPGVPGCLRIRSEPCRSNHSGCDCTGRCGHPGPLPAHRRCGSSHQPGPSGNGERDGGLGSSEAGQGTMVHRSQRNGLSGMHAGGGCRGLCARDGGFFIEEPQCVGAIAGLRPCRLCGPLQAGSEK